MKKLLGIHRSEDEFSFIVQENGKIFVEHGNEKNINDFSNSKLILKRDEMIRDPLGEEGVEGEGVFDFRYGPVTSGVGEAGIYHLFTYGERILDVKIDTSYKRRGLDLKMKGKNVNEGLRLAQSVCGNFTISHSLAFVRAVENALNVKIPRVSEFLRAVALELERMYNHMYVISRLASAAAQLVLSSHLQGLFEALLVVNEKFSKSRFLRDFVKIGGVAFVPKSDSLNGIITEVERISNDFSDLFERSLESRNYIDRLHSTATLKAEDAEKIGLTGPSLRACNVLEDLRRREGVYATLETITDEEGDSLSRMEVRAKEIIQSAKFVIKTLREIDDEKPINDSIRVEDSQGLGTCESPSGSVVYLLNLKGGKIEDVYISTPSVFGFAAIAHSMRENIFTDFPFAVESYGVNFADAAR